MPLGHPQYRVVVSDPFGVPLGDASEFASLKYARVVNDWSTATITLPSTFDQSLLRIPDGRLEIWRRPLQGSREVLDTETIWLIKAPQWDRDDKGNQTITVEADTPLCILKEPGRFVNYASGAGQTLQTAPADNMIKAVARQNIGSAAVAARDLSTYITIAPDLSLAPSMTKAFALRDCLKVMREIADSSAESDTYLAFDMVAPTPSTLEFRTYVGWRGIDHRFPAGINPVIIGPDFGNMGACSLRLDYRNEITFAVAGGRGEGSDRLVGGAQDAIRIGASPFGRREKFISATQYTTTTGLSAEAAAAVRGGRPRVSFKGKLLSVPGCLYGVHWAWGDYVTAQAFGQSFDCRIDAITVTVANGKETIDAWLRAELR